MVHLLQGTSQVKALRLDANRPLSPVSEGSDPPELVRGTLGPENTGDRREMQVRGGGFGGEFWYRGLVVEFGFWWGSW